MKRSFKLLSVFLLTVCVSSIHGNTSASLSLSRSLKTEQANPAEVSGSFALILYGGRFADDIETVAILDAEGDQYNFEPYAPDFDYKVKKGVSAKEAVSMAKGFVSFHNAFWRSQLSKIFDNSGKVIGYEMRPLYQAWNYAVSDVLDVSYRLEQTGRVRILIRLVPSVERSRFPGGSHEFSGRH